MTNETNGDVLRRVERQCGDDWEECRMMDLDKGDVFRMFEPSGVPVVGLQDATKFKATALPELLDTGVASVDADMIIQ